MQKTNRSENTAKDEALTVSTRYPHSEATARNLTKRKKQQKRHLQGLRRTIQEANELLYNNLEGAEKRDLRPLQNPQFIHSLLEQILQKLKEGQIAGKGLTEARLGLKLVKGIFQASRISSFRYRTIDLVLRYLSHMANCSEQGARLSLKILALLISKNWKLEFGAPLQLYQIFGVRVQLISNPKRRKRYLRDLERVISGWRGEEHRKQVITTAFPFETILTSETQAPATPRALKLRIMAEHCSEFYFKQFVKFFTQNIPGWNRFLYEDLSEFLNAQLRKKDELELRNLYSRKLHHFYDKMFAEKAMTVQMIKYLVVYILRFGFLWPALQFDQQRIMQPLLGQLYYGDEGEMEGLFEQEDEAARRAERSLLDVFIEHNWAKSNPAYIASIRACHNPDYVVKKVLHNEVKRQILRGNEVKFLAKSGKRLDVDFIAREGLSKHVAWVLYGGRWEVDPSTILPYSRAGEGHHLALNAFKTRDPHLVQGLVNAGYMNPAKGDILQLRTITNRRARKLLRRRQTVFNEAFFKSTTRRVCRIQGVNYIVVLSEGRGGGSSNFFEVKVLETGQPLLSINVSKSDQFSVEGGVIYIWGRNVMTLVEFAGKNQPRLTLSMPFSHCLIESIHPFDNKLILVVPETRNQLFLYNYREGYYMKVDLAAEVMMDLKRKMRRIRSQCLPRPPESVRE